MHEPARLKKSCKINGDITNIKLIASFFRESRSDDQLLFTTTGGIKLKRMELGSGTLYYMNAAIMTGCLWVLVAYRIMDIIIPKRSFPVHSLGFYTFIGYISRKESHILLQFCPPISLLIAALSVYYSETEWDFDWHDYSLIPLWLSIYILARFRSPRDNCPFHKKVKVVARLSRAILLVAATYGLLTWFGSIDWLMMFGSSVLGNLQIPMALARIMLSWVCLFRNQNELLDTNNKNVKLAVKILYIMVMCQGILYLAACILDSLSFLFRRSLALGSRLTDKLGMKSVNLYYEHAYDTFLQESLFDTTKKMGLGTFALDCLNPKASRDKKHAAIRILDSFLQKHKTSSPSTELVSVITTSIEAVTTLINMLGWSDTEDADIRLFAAKVIGHISPYVQIIGINGTVQKVSSLLDARDEPMTQVISAQIVHDNGGNADDRQISKDACSPIVNGNARGAADRQQTIYGSSNSPSDIEGGNIPAVRGCSLVYIFFVSVLDRVRTFREHLKELQSVTRRDSKDKDSVPALGMKIVEGLAHDLHNCEEISRATELLPKIIGFVSYINGSTLTQREEITTSSLNLLSKLASIKGKVGITFRQELSQNPFLFGSLAEILELDGSPSYLEQSKLAMDIIAKIARISIDKKTRRKIGAFQVIIDKLVQEFLGVDEDELSNPFKAVAGEALEMLAMECPSNCCSMLDNTNYDLIEDLAYKLQCGRHIHTAASLLQSLCKNSKQLVLNHQGSNHILSSSLKVVLGRIKDAEGKQMTALIGLASQICNVMSERIAPVLDAFADDKAFVVKLKGELKARKKPSPDEFPDMRRLLVELTISIVESCPRYALIFRENGMMEALSKVEQYIGLVSEEAEALPAMVARAKELIGADTP
ncbi:hypothetical protein VPH35_126265 [Triticum aestivum]